MAVRQHFQYLGGVLRVGDECSGRCSRRALVRSKRVHAYGSKELMHACGSRTECMPGVQARSRPHAREQQVMLCQGPYCSLLRQATIHLRLFPVCNTAEGWQAFVLSLYRRCGRLRMSAPHLLLHAGSQQNPDVTLTVQELLPCSSKSDWLQASSTLRQPDAGRSRMHGYAPLCYDLSGSQLVTSS